MQLDIIKLNAIDSTNSFLKELAKKSELEDRTVVITENQIEGRGQRGSKWFSESGKSLSFSMFKRFEHLLPKKQFMISMAVSLGVLDALVELDIPKVSTKWPNDIMSGRKKLGGILIENVFEKNLVKYSVIGVGINVNNTSFMGLPNASSLKIQAKADFDLDALFSLILEKCYEELDQLEFNSFAEVQRRYEKRMFGLDKISVFEDAEGTKFNGIIRGISGEGYLILETEEKTEVLVQVKQLKMVL